MKRVNNLLEQIADPENLRYAFWKAKKGKSYSQQVQRYRINLENNLFQLRGQILNGLIDVGDYRYFKVYDPKERQICASAFSEQVLHHALMNICHDYFEKAQIYDSYASRPEKGIHAALHRSSAFTKSGSWFLKLDIRKFFGSIHHITLKKQLRRIFKDIYLLDIFEKIIDSYESSTERGLPIGNLTSQYFANHYLSSLDHFIKEQLRAKSYVRYMDDLVLWHQNKQWLKDALKGIKNFVVEQLKLELKPILLNSSDRGLPFCGYKIYPQYIHLTQRSKRRYISKMNYLNKQYKHGNWSEASCQRRAQSLIAFTSHADSLAFRKKVWEKLQPENCKP